ncbi:YebG family protein [Agarivorans sp. MS3-6]|uniref:YebG family protein n=1 Tax=Agarivorans sp. TSD2052 TaxID=2937286 RepID=UPI00200E6DAD|nr:YebG family protein [Agarivorans sp. TSD2052]UPW20587.1 YebG family protein [Agarivorans sp. TSD2052]
MAVIIKYVVERNGVEKMTFSSKKEADSYDKMLDVADQLSLLIKHAEPKISEQLAENLGFYLSSQRNALQHILKGQEFDPSLIEKEEV